MTDLQAILSVGKSPKVTVIMPIRNEASYIKRSLGTVLAQDYLHTRLEILVVDGMSTDDTRKIISDLAIRNPQSTIRIIDNPGTFVPTGLNAALLEAKGEIVFRVDGHAEIAGDYVSRCIDILEKTKADCVGGPMTTVGETWVAQSIALVQRSRFGVGGVAFRTNNKKASYVDTVAFGAYRHEVFERIGGFDEELVRNQDDEFNFRLIQAGGKVWFDPSIRSIYYSRANLRSLWKQYFDYGLYKIRVIQKRRAIPSWRHLVPGVFILGLFLTILMALIMSEPLWFLAVTGPYAATNLFASLWTARRDWKTLPLLPLAFSILHLSYGLGFLWGLWKWRKKWSEPFRSQLPY
jgi:succinoglycan biosynthesis protein ExoA